MRWAVTVLGVALATFESGCERPRTEIVVRVDSEIPWGPDREVQAVVLSVRRGGAGGSLRSTRTIPLGPGTERHELPLYVGLIESDGDMDTPVWVEALGCGDPNGCTAATARVAQRAVVRFRLGQTEELPLLLATACLDVECRADQRCSASTGRCEEATAAQATLRPFQGADSGLMDAAKVVDASNDLGPDAIDAATADVIADVGVMDLESDAPRPMDGGTRDVSAEDLSLDSASMLQDAPVTQDVEVNACADGGIECGDGCRDIRTDVLHCGACNNRCPSGASGSAVCISSRCGLSCSDGFGDCDGVPSNGCEVDVRTSSQHCGACGRMCAPANGVGACVAGTCALTSCISSSYADCDGVPTNGCEVNLLSSVDNCGVCGRGCSLPNASARCDSGCQVAACSEGFGDCDRAVTNGCETDLRANVARCGVCGFRCALGAGAACSGARCVRPSTLAVRQIGTGEVNAPEAFAVARNGDHYFAGRFRGAATFGADTLMSIGVENAFLANTSASGDVRWARRIGFEGATFVSEVSTTPSNLVAIVGSALGPLDFGGGMLSAGGFLAIYDSAGTHRWSRTWPSLWLTHVVGGSDGNLYVVGEFSGTVDFGGATLSTTLPTGTFAASVGSDGTHRWARVLTSPASVTAVALSATNNLYVAGPVSTDQGLTISSFTPTGVDRSSVVVVTPTTRVATDGIAVSPTDGSMFAVGNAAGRVVFGDTAITLGVTGTAFIVALNAAGATRWARGYAQPGATSNGASSVTIWPAGILVAGTFQQSIDLGGGALDGNSSGATGFVVSLGSDGSYGWSQRFGNYVRHMAVAADGAGDVSIAGTCRGQSLLSTITPCLQTDIATISSIGREAAFLLRLRP